MIKKLFLSVVLAVAAFAANAAPSLENCVQYAQFAEDIKEVQLAGASREQVEGVVELQYGREGFYDTLTAIVSMVYNNLAVLITPEDAGRVVFMICAKQTGVPL